MRTFVSLVAAGSILMSGLGAVTTATALPQVSAQREIVKVQSANKATPKATVAAKSAKKATTRTNMTGLVNGMQTAPPLYVGYKAGSFLPVGAKAKKDKRGCSLGKQLLISMAIKKPKVAKKCKLIGGTWSVDFGTKIVKSSAFLSVVPIIDDKDAWGHGASSWTQAERTAYARNTGGGTKTTRLQSTNQILTKNFLTNLKKIAWNAGVRSADSKIRSSSSLKSTPANPIFQNSLWWFGLPNPTPPASPTFVPVTEPLPVPMFMQQSFGWMSDFSFEAELLGSGPFVCRNATPVAAGFLSNMAAWGLTIDQDTQASLASLATVCPSEEQYTVAFENAVASASFTAASSSTSQGVGVAGSSTGTVGAATTTTWKTFSDYSAPTGPVTTGELFGIHTPDLGSQPLPAGSMPNVPFGYVRLWDSNTSWRSVEPNVKGTYEWTTMDLAVQRVRDTGSKVMMVLGYTPAWASESGAASAPPSNFDDYSAYVRNVACRYGDAISSYEVWNEGNLSTFWTGTPEQLADLTQRAYTEVKKCSNAQVIAASTGTRASGPFATNYLPYLEALKGRGWPIDGFSVHSYPTASGGASDRLDGLKQFKSMLAASGAPVKPLYDTELNYGLAGLGEAHTDLNDTQSAAGIVRSYIDSVRYGLTSTFWYLWSTGYHPTFGIQMNPSTPMNSVAWTQAYIWLVGSRLQRCSEFQTDAESGLVTVCQFTHAAGENYSLMWTEPGKQARLETTGLGTQTCDAWGACLKIQKSVNVTEVPRWVGNAANMYAPSTVNDPTEPNVPTTIEGSCGLTPRGAPVWTFGCTDFGSLSVGSTKVMPVTVTNQSTKTRTLIFRIQGNKDVKIVDRPSSCTSSGAVLAGKYASCTLYVAWSPQSPGSIDASIIGTDKANSSLAYQGRLTGSAD